MAEFAVAWHIDVDADSPLEAARLARQMQSPGTTALVFEVRDRKGLTHQIDLAADTSFIRPFVPPHTLN